MALFLLILIPVPFLVFWLWMLRDMLNNDYLSRKEKDDWILKFIFMNVIAAGLYYFIEYKSRNL